MTLSSRSRMSALITVVAFVTIIGGLLAALTLRGALPHLPLTDDSPIPLATNKSTAGLTFADFYPYYSTTNSVLQVGGGLNIPLCTWQLGAAIPGSITDFGKNAQYGTFLNLSFTGFGGAPIFLIEDFHNTLNQVPCQPGAAAALLGQLEGTGGNEG